MLYEEIKEVEIDRIVAGVRRLLDIGFTMEEINGSVHKGLEQMLLNLPTAKMYEIQKMQEHKKLMEKENGSKHDITN